MRLAKLSLLLLLGAFSSLACAGYSQPLPVVIDTTSYAPLVSVYANMADARHSSGFISCQVYEDEFVNCSARNAAGADATCTISDARLPQYQSPMIASFLPVARSIKSTSLVQFWFDPSTHKCTDLVVSNGSQFLPNVAGARVRYPVSVSAGYIAGTLSGTRFSSDAFEYLQCVSYASGYVYCVAQDAAYHVGWCATTAAANPSFAADVLAIGSASYVSIWYDAAGTCTGITTYGGSQFAP
jgi:hypothetical protein